MSANILTVDDSASIRLTTKVTLTNAGYAVTEAVNGAEGLATAQTAQFDLIVTDLNMPVMDGLTMIEELRKLPSERTRNCWRPCVIAPPPAFRLARSSALNS